MGSIPPAASFEHPMRELFKSSHGIPLTPNDTDLKQVETGIRSQRSNYVEDVGTENALAVAYDPPITAYTVGLPLRVKVKNANSGASTVNAGPGTVPIRRPSGPALPQAIRPPMD